MGKNVGVITDSNSGITQKQASELGITVLAMPFTIDDKEYFEDINLTQDEFYEKLLSDCNIFTSQPSPESVMDLWDRALKEFDELVYIPMSSGLSGSYQTARMLAEDYNGKIQVVNNQRISVTMRQSVLDAIALSKTGMNALEIKSKLENDKFNSSIYIMVDTLEYLKKGGRLTPAAAMLGTLLKIKPVLQIQGEKLDSFAKVRTLSQAKSVMINQIESDIINRFEGSKSGKGVNLHIAYTYNYENAEVFEQEVRERFPDASLYVDKLSLSVSCHIGPGALALAATKNSF